MDVRARRINEALDEDTIVLVAGFQGVSADSFDVTTLGRGGSDTTAVALAAALGAGACEIYTDVQGVYTADPRLVPTARKLDALTHEEMLEMAASGARVLATRSIEVARSHNVKLHVRSTFGTEEGTWIREEDETMLEKALISGSCTSSRRRFIASRGHGGNTLLCARRGEHQRRHDRPDRPGDSVLGTCRGSGRRAARARRSRCNLDCAR